MGTLILYRADGAVHTELCPETVVDDRAFLDKLQQLVGGYIEIVWVLYNGKRTAMIVNEDGLSLGLPPNIRGTEIYRETAKLSGHDSRDVVVGDVVVLEGVTIK